MGYSVRLAVTEVLLWLNFVEHNDKPYFTEAFGSVLNILVSRLNTTMADVKSTENIMDFGQITGPNSGTGLIGFIMRNESDLGAFPLIMSYDTFQYTDFLGYITGPIWTICSAKPIKTTDVRFAAATIFTNEIWICIIVIILAVPIIWYTVCKLFNYRHDKFGDILFETFSIFLCQGSDYVRSNIVHIFFWGLFSIASFLIVMSYSAILLSKILLSDKPIFIEKISDIFLNPNLKVAVGSENMGKYVMNSKSEEMMKLAEQINRTVGFLSHNDVPIGDMMEENKEGKLVVIVDKNVLLFIHDLLDLCDPESDFRFSKEVIHEPMFPFVIRRGTPEKEKLKIKGIFDRYRDSGCIQWDINIRSIMGSLCTSDPPYEEPVNKIYITNLIFPFIIYGAGIAISILSMVFTLLTYYCA